MRRSVLTGIASSIWFSYALEQVDTNVTCLAQTQWMENPLGQNPCLVSAYLSAACSNGTWFVPTLVASGPYNPPEGPNATPCRCNTIEYNLLQACSVCQGGLVGTWGDWISFCPSPDVGKSFPEAVPSQTIIPGWANLDPTITGSWNATEAEQYAVASTNHNTSASTGTNSNANAGSGSENKSSNVPAIVGGVVGGIIGLLCLCLAVFFFVRYNKESKGEKVTPVPYGGPIDQGYNHGGYAEKDAPHRMDLGTPAPLMGGMNSGSAGHMRPYDPSDPSTFPESPAPASTFVSHDASGAIGDYNSIGAGPTYPPYQSGSPAPHGSGARPPAPGGYTGAAEV